ncbi:hypothetical protein HD554DRAFT_2083175 [Boletus coccyginus]|nr:hypothetical protein HD554DRAFT_2083175 [Boletus coccyginus]
MDGVDPSYGHATAVAGPSSIIQDAPAIFLPPPMALSQPQGFLTSTQDLLARFRLHAAYDKHVRVPLDPSPAPAQSNLPLPPDSDEKKKKNSYRHLIKSLPGKHSMKKDDYLVTIMQAPPKQHIPMVQFDVKTQKEAFTVSAEGLKGWNTGTLVLESAQAKEDRRKRKELKKLARAQGQGLTPGPLPGTPTAFSQPQPTPSHPANPSAQQLPGASQNSQTKPRVAPVTIPPPGSVSQSTSTPTSATPRSAVPPAALPTAPSQWTNTPVPGRGQKRELEDGVVPPTPTSLSPNVPVGVVGARAGIANVRPRPIKKQRMDIQGQSREVLVQQPTPQGS